MFVYDAIEQALDSKRCYGTHSQSWKMVGQGSIFIASEGVERRILYTLPLLNLIQVVFWRRLPYGQLSD